jgi:hypothetical protein
MKSVSVQGDQGKHSSDFGVSLLLTVLLTNYADVKKIIEMVLFVLRHPSKPRQAGAA